MLNLEKIKGSNTEKLGFFRFKKFDKDTYLITNDAGKFEFLNLEEFDNFIAGNVEGLDKYDSLLQKGFIKNDDYEAKMTGSVSMKNHFVGSGPTLHMIITTLRCNHMCRYCHAAVAPMTAENYDMTLETAKTVVDTIFYTNSPSLTIEFQGGESMVNYKVVKFVVEYAKERALHLNKNLSFVMVSNLTLMEEDKLKWLLDEGVDVCTSLDGDELTHNSNRVGYDGNSYKKVTYWMKRVDEEKQKRGMGKIGALLTVTKETIPRYKEIIDTYVELGQEGIFLRWLNPYGFAADERRDLAYDKKDWIEFYKKSLDYIIEINKKGTFFRESITGVYLKKIFDPIDPAFMDIRSPSGIAVGGVAYNYDGKIYASDESRMLGRMGDDSFLLSNGTGTGEENYKEMLNSEVTKISVQSSTLDGLPGYNEHVYKPYFGVDIIHNYKTTGNVYTPFKKDEKIDIQIEILDYIFKKLRNPEDEKVLMSWLND